MPATRTLQVIALLADGDLSCAENDPAPTGGGNHVSGNTEDQCRGL